MSENNNESGNPAKLLALSPPTHSEQQGSAITKPQDSSVKQEAENAVAVVKAVTQGLKEIFETPGWSILLQGVGQSLASQEERLTAMSAQEHERQKLRLAQEHERAMQLDRLRMESEQRRMALGARVVLGAAILAILIIAAGLAAIKFGWIDEKTATIAVFIIVGVVTQTHRVINSKSSAPQSPASSPPLPPPAQSP